jgi:hypothetical protein
MSTARISRNAPCLCGSGKKFKHCCHAHSFGNGVPQPRPIPTDGAFLRRGPEPPRRPPPQLKPITRVAVEYAISDALGKAEVTFCYELGTPIIMADGNVLPVEYLKPGMQFRLEDGGVATTTKVEEPKVWQPPSQERDAHGNSPRRVIGRVHYKGYFPRMDFGVSGDVIKTTPGHLFYSVTRGGWHPIETFQRGESLRNERGMSVPVEWISPIRWEFCDLYNIEVEDFHTYYVGGGPSGGIWTHNGMDMACRVPRAAKGKAPKWANSPETGGLKGHAAKHGGVGSIPSKPAAYYNHALKNMRTGTPYRFYHDGQFKIGYVTDVGNGRYVFTSVSQNGKTIFTHMEVSGQYLRNLGITLKGG